MFSPRVAAICSASGIHIATIRLAVLRMRSRRASSRPIRHSSTACRSPVGFKNGTDGDIGIAVIGQERELPDVAQFARAAVFGNPLIDQIRARGGVDPERVVEALEQEFRREFGGNPGRMPIQAIVFSAARR